MPLIGFSVMLDKLRDGSKTQTIRKLRKQPLKVGDKLYIYWKLRTKKCKKLGEGICTETFFVNLQFIENFLGSGEPAYRIDVSEKLNLSHGVFLSFITMTDNQCQELAKRDGLESATEMLRALSHMHKGLDGTFQVIRWKWTKKEAAP